MEFFDKFVSNTTAGSGSQTVFYSDNKPHTGRIFYRITAGGKYRYSLLFSNIIDSTFSDGTRTQKNMIVDSWILLSARIGKCEKLDFAHLSETAKKQNKPITTHMGDGAFSAENLICVGNFVPLTFGGRECHEVMPGEFFASDPIELEFSSGEYLCFEITYSGKMLPYHDESIIPAFLKDGEHWVYSKHMPFPGMIGCDRQVAKRVCFIGDSITQGCGTEINSYTHWNARLAEMLGTENAFWNLGYGYARANDAASNGAWLFKAKQNDIAVVCFGVNDILSGHSADRVKADLAEIVDKLHAANTKVLVQTVPPFDYTGEYVSIWDEVNRFIRTELSGKADVIFDDVPILSTGGENCPTARYCGHPNAEGCLEWAKALCPVLRDFLAEQE